jgi:predicted metal-binding protein
MRTIIEDYLFEEIEQEFEKSSTIISQIKCNCDGKMNRSRIDSLISIHKKIVEVNTSLTRLYQWTRSFR